MRQVLQEQQLDRPADYSLVLKGADPLRFGRLRASEQALTFSMVANGHCHNQASASGAQCVQWLFVFTHVRVLFAGMQVSKTPQQLQRVPRKASPER